MIGLEILPTEHLMHGFGTSIALIGFRFAIAQIYEYVERGYQGWTGKILAPPISRCLHRPQLVRSFSGCCSIWSDFGSHKKRPICLYGTARLPRIMANSVLIIGLFGLTAVGAAIFLQESD